MSKFWGPLSLVVLLTGTSAFAGVEVGGTRLVFKAEEKESSISVNNNDKDKPYLVQSWVDLPEGQEGKAPFVITPPLFRLDGEQKNILRVLKTNGDLPADRESLFWLNIKSIPTVADNMRRKNVLQFAVKNRMKLFYRPTGLQGTPEKAAAQVTWKKKDNTIIAENKSGYYVNLSSLTIQGNKLAIDYTNSAIPPLSSTTFTPKQQINTGATVSWKTLNDFGAVSKDYSAAIQ